MKTKQCYEHHTKCNKNYCRLEPVGSEYGKPYQPRYTQDCKDVQSGFGKDEGYVCICADNSKPQHTPTPWNSQTDKREDGTPVCVIRDSSGSNIAEIYCADPIDEANAAFIVRAVNAHEELLEAARHFKECGPKVHDPANFDDCRNADQAIAKAEGLK